MGISELLIHLADPATIKTLSLGQKLMASLVVTLLGMGVTFLALIVLQLVISLLARFSSLSSGQTTVQQPAVSAAAVQHDVAAGSDDELIAVMSAAIAMFPSPTPGTIVIRNIRKIETQVPAWNRVGMLDQMNSRF